MSLEPCAKETPEQISELENAADKNRQVEILLERIGEKDEWLRSCAIFRLGEFRDEAREALPVIIKLLRDEKNDDVWRHVETALWKIPPDGNIPLRERIELSMSDNVYIKTYGVYALSYFKPIAGTVQSDETLDALIVAARDTDTTVCWLAVMGIRQLGFYGINTSKTIPVLSEALQAGKINPIHPIRAFVPMGANALPAAPLLFDVLYNPKKYAGKDEDNVRSSNLYLTAAIALGRIGKPLLPLLTKEISRQPFDVIQVLGNISDDGVLPIFYQAMNHKNPKVRKKAIENLPSFNSTGAIEALPYLLTAMRDTDLEVRLSSISNIGSIARFTKEKSPELQEMLRKKVIPSLISRLKDKESDIRCYSALALGKFGADAESAIPALAGLVNKERRDYCAESALFDIGEKGRKFLTVEQVENQIENKKIESEVFESSPSDYNKAKSIKPKTKPSPAPIVKDS